MTKTSFFQKIRKQVRDSLSDELYYTLHPIAQWAKYPVRWANLKKDVEKQAQEKKSLFAVYDCADLPISYDIFSFLVHAESQRRKEGLDKIDIAFVCHHEIPGPRRHPYLKTENYRTLLHNIMLEATRLYPTVGSVFFFDNRKQLQESFESFTTSRVLFPSHYNPYQPNAAPPSGFPVIHSWISVCGEVEKDPTLLCVSPEASQVRLVQKWLREQIAPKIPITITLREWGEWTPSRNSHIAEWQKLIDHYRDEPFVFIILRDFYKLYEEPCLVGDNVVYYDEAVTQLSLRGALYQEVTLNLFVNNGCSLVAQYNNHANYILFKMFDDSTNVTNLRTIKTYQDLEYGDQWHGAHDLQRVVWEEDSFEIMNHHFSEFLQKLKEREQLIPSFYGSEG